MPNDKSGHGTPSQQNKLHSVSANASLNHLISMDLTVSYQHFNNRGYLYIAVLCLFRRSSRGTVHAGIEYQGIRTIESWVE
jgi:hypothetical protein